MFLNRISHLTRVLTFLAGILPCAVSADFTDQSDERLQALIDQSYGFALLYLNLDDFIDIAVANKGQSRLLVNQGAGTSRTRPKPGFRRSRTTRSRPTPRMWMTTAIRTCCSSTDPVPPGS